MLFNSLTFIIFIAIVMGVFSLPLPWTFRKSFLLVASYLFYAAWSPVFVLLLWLSTIVDWLVAARLFRELERQNFPRQQYWKRPAAGEFTLKTTPNSCNLTALSGLISVSTTHVSLRAGSTNSYIIHKEICTVERPLDNLVSVNSYDCRVDCQATCTLCRHLL